MSKERIELLKELRDVVNENDNANVTLQQVDFYIGEYMKEECIRNWIEETREKMNPVTAHEILYKWNNGYTFEA